MLGEKIKYLRDKLDLSQEYIAKNVGIQRVAISQIENGKRKITADEILKFSKIFNISSDILLDLKQDIKITLEKSSKKNTQQNIRISVPQQKLDKIKETLIYILWKVGGRPNIGETVLNKLLYFIDFDYYEKYEVQLLGATYIKNHYGPTPKELIKIIQTMEKDNEVRKIKDSYFQYPQKKYLALREPDLTKFNASEISLIDEVLNKLASMDAKTISNYVHNDVPWLTTQMGEIIDYESVFYRTPLYSVRNYEQ
jgi:transcriptional regulator with XRE-family HTH domain